MTSISGKNTSRSQIIEGVVFIMLTLESLCLPVLVGGVFMVKSCAQSLKMMNNYNNTHGNTQQPIMYFQVKLDLMFHCTIGLQINNLVKHRQKLIL